MDSYTWKETAKSYGKTLEEIENDSDQDRGLLPIPDYYTHPSPRTDIGLDRLKDLYFSRNQ